MEMLKQGKFSSNEEVIQLTNQVGQLRRAIASTATTITENTTTTVNDYDGSESVGRISGFEMDEEHNPQHMPIQVQTSSTHGTETGTVQRRSKTKLQRQSNISTGSVETLPENRQLTETPYGSPEIRTFKNNKKGNNTQTKIITVNLPAPGRPVQQQILQHNRDRNVQKVKINQQDQDRSRNAGRESKTR